MSVLFTAKGKQKEVLQKLKTLYLQNLSKDDLDKDIILEIIEGSPGEIENSSPATQGEEWLKTELTKFLDTLEE